MTGCSVKGCKNRSEYFSANFSRYKVGYHTFPKDENLCAEWIKACGIKNIKASTAKVCSAHFLPSAFRIFTRSKQPQPSSKYRRLKEDAIPTENLPQAGEEVSNSILTEKLTQIDKEASREDAIPREKLTQIDEEASVSPCLKNIENIVDLDDDESQFSPVSFLHEKRMKITNFSQPKPVSLNSELAKFLLENPANSTVQRGDCNNAKSDDSESVRERIASNYSIIITNMPNEDSDSAEDIDQSSGSVQNLQEEDVSFYEKEIRKLNDETNILKRKLREKYKQLLISKSIKKKYESMLESVSTPKEMKLLMQNGKQRTKKWSAEDIV